MQMPSPLMQRTGQAQQNQDRRHWRTVERAPECTVVLARPRQARRWLLPWLRPSASGKPPTAQRNQVHKAVRGEPLELGLASRGVGVCLESYGASACLRA